MRVRRGAIKLSTPASDRLRSARFRCIQDLDNGGFQSDILFPTADKVHLAVDKERTLPSTDLLWLAANPPIARDPLGIERLGYLPWAWSAR